jgi:hypothetical protein
MWASLGLVTATRSAARGVVVYVMFVISCVTSDAESGGD